MSIKQLAYSDIKRGNLYWTAIPYSDGRPLISYISCNNCDSDCKISSDELGCTTLEMEDENNIDDAFYYEDGHSKEINILVRHKVRMTIVIQNNEMNTVKNYNHVYVAPITTKRAEKLSSEDIEILKLNLDKQTYFLGEYTGKLAFINLVDVKRVHKSLLLKPVYNINPISEEIMDDIMKKFADLVSINKISACDNCTQACNNCHIRKLFLDYVLEEEKIAASIDK